MNRTDVSGCRDHQPRWPRGPWPDREQLLLLQACLLEDSAAARAAWNAWRSRVPIDVVDNGSHRLLPLLHRRLREFGSKTADHDRIKGVARYYWVRYEQQMQCLRQVLTQFAAAGIETLLLKGSALNLGVYPPGIRPLSDLDVAVPRDAAERAIQLLQRSGWRSSVSKPERLVRALPGCEFESAAPPALDLHWDFFHGRILTTTNQQLFWQRSERVQVAGAPSRIFSATHQLLHTCGHGARRNVTPPLRWLADACLIIRHQAKQIDWDELVELAQRHELLLHVRSTLTFLAKQLDSAIPSATLEGLCRAGVSSRARVEYFCTSRGTPDVHPLLSTLPVHLVGYWRNRNQLECLRLSEYLRAQYYLDRPLTHYLSHLCIAQTVDAVMSLRRWAGAVWRRLWGAAPEYVAYLGAGRSWRFEGFQRRQWSRGGLYRWSNQEASIILTALPADSRVEITLAPLPCLPAGAPARLSIWFNGSAIPRDRIVEDGRRLTFPIDRAQFVVGDRQRLLLRCQPLPGDARELGLPICSIRISPLPSKAQERGAA